MRSVYNILGWVFVTLGIIGTILPLMPTTIFLILASVCFSRGSPQYKEWLLNHPRFGVYLRDFHAGRGIPKKCKIIAISMIWTSIGSTSILFINALWLQLLLLSIAASVSLYLYWLPTTVLTRCPVLDAKAKLKAEATASLIPPAASCPMSDCNKLK